MRERHVSISATERKNEGASEREIGRDVDNVFVTFESVRVTEWNGSSMDSRWVGTVRAVATANRARCFRGAGRERKRERANKRSEG